MFDFPQKTGFTVYSKSGCNDCCKAIMLLNDNKQPFLYIDCDDYLIFDRDGFLDNIRKVANQDVKMFPMIFLDNKYIGGLKPLLLLVQPKMEKKNIII